MRVELTVIIDDVRDAPPPLVRLRRGLKALWRGHRIKVIGIRPAPDRSVARPGLSAGRTRFNADLLDRLTIYLGVASRSRR